MSYVQWVYEEENKERKEYKVFEMVMTENFPKCLTSNQNIQIQTKTLIIFIITDQYVSGTKMQKSSIKYQRVESNNVLKELCNRPKGIYPSQARLLQYCKIKYLYPCHQHPNDENTYDNINMQKKILTNFNTILDKNSV